MASAAVHPAMNFEGKKSIHPFFTKPTKNQLSETEVTSNDAHLDEVNSDPNFEQPDPDVQTDTGRRKRARKAEKEGVRLRGQAALDAFTRPVNGRTADVLALAGQPSLEEEVNDDRRKRRKTESPPAPQGDTAPIDPRHSIEDLGWQEQLEAEAGKDHSYATKSPSPPLLQPDEDQSSKDSEIASKARIIGPDSESISKGPPKAATPKKRVLKVTKNGKLLSSPTIAAPESATSNSPRRKRERKQTKIRPSPTVTVIKYGTDATTRRILGQKIQDILEGRKQDVALPIAPAKVPPKPLGPSKPTHPFFMGKAAAKNVDESPIPCAPRISRPSAITPGKLRAESRSHNSPASIPVFGPIAGDNRAAKHAGLKEAPWPSKNNVHVRNIEHQDPEFEWESRLNTNDPMTKARKLKATVTFVPQHEDLIAKCSQQVRSAIQMNETEHSLKNLENVRLPTRLLTTGFDMQERIRHQVTAALPRDDDLKDQPSRTHPALISLFKDIEHTLTPFDLGVCESKSWVQKYAPTSVSHVLQSGRQTVVLRDWLENLTVSSVNSRQDRAKITVGADARKPAKKKRKKAEDCFIVSDDDQEEDEEMVEMSGSEDYGRPEWGFSQPKSLKRPRMVRNQNVIILSGPHGCGKSATVYAVAKELGFDVFEINSGSRRSGKDIQDKVGDMTENHLVNQKHEKSAVPQDQALGEEADNERISKAFQDDLASGRQGTMASFFSSKPKSGKNSKPQPKTIPTPKPKATASAAQSTLLASAPKSQKQSLVLFEEADVLFDEDQQFWSHVHKLASLSKRPIIITCTNESLIPMHELPLAAVLRLGPPPTDLAVDYLLLLAAREGHLLQRRAVKDLFRRSENDLRASITELNFWCQMSIGDRKGGLEWIYQRYPPGKDVDEHGRNLRVASENTYQSSMGCVSHDVAVSAKSTGFDEDEEISRQMWTSWSLNPDRWTEAHNEATLSDGTNSSRPSSTLAILEQLDCMSDSASAADIYCRIGLPSYNDHALEPTDPTLPPMSSRERLNYTEAAPVLQTDHVSDFSDLDTKLHIQTHLQIQRAFNLEGTAVARGKTVVDEDGLVKAVLKRKRDVRTKKSLTWPDFSEAFDILASPPATTFAVSTAYQLAPSSFDRTFRIVVEDLAPYVRSIVAHELRLDAQRLRLGNLLSEGGTGKRGRTTRASRVALEGGRRETKRRENWFDKDLNRTLAMGTAGDSWAGLGAVGHENESVSASMTGESLVSTQEDMME
ncbi:P-loop containing nucleoside triphosphate hydrolase protein [Polyplosphaeria fusca]|uniref:P-loop containing nucleoside triphosphate hydrolase protein n=1 Tax=Polyplosphaeria fusca TaxID=682080 RepID=A0A9P4QZP4_9PLEO|nr:P-loop containing nucleoside triphosphate hydrolase protein [Polyplosphaeria fusca]